MTSALQRTFMAGVIASISFPALGEATPVTSDKVDGDSLIVTTASGILRLQVRADNAIRVTYAAGTAIPELKSYTVIAPPSAIKWDRTQTTDSVGLNTGTLRATVDRKTAAVSFLDARGNLILKESDAGREIAPAVQPGVEGTLCRQSFILPPDEGIYGLGQHQQGIFNYRGHAVRLLQQNMEVGIPVMLSSKGYTFLWGVRRHRRHLGRAEKPGPRRPQLLRLRHPLLEH